MLEIRIIESCVIMRFIVIILLFFCFTAKIGTAKQKYERIDLYKETSFFKDGKKHRVKRLNPKQKRELAEIFNKYDLLSDGQTEADIPFIGYIAIFHIAINKKNCLLFMVNNTNHLSFHCREEYTQKLFWLQKRGDKRSSDIRIFELESLYLELEKFLEKSSYIVAENDK